MPARRNVKKTTRRARYPVEHETDVLLKDGSTVHMRPIRTDDGRAIVALFRRLSRRTIYLRFHHMVREMTAQQARAYTHVDYHDSFGLVATQGEAQNEQIIAVAHYQRSDEPGRAEVAFLVEDSHQGRGIATQLLDQLAAIAYEKGIRIFEAEVLAANKPMMDVFRESGFTMEARFEYGTYHVAFPIRPTAKAARAAEGRERLAEAASIAHIFRPKSVAVIGASRQRGTFGAEIFHNIVQHGYSGVVYPINPKADTIDAVRAYASIEDVPGEVELAIVVVPAEQVLAVVDQCGRKGVKALVVISAGFKETGAEGLAREQELLAKARSYGMRLVGPNCMGVLNTSPEAPFDATVAPTYPPRGNVALLSQSGALGLALLDYARALNIGLSSFISVGNKADVSANDLIQYWEQDPETDVILLYLESFGNPRKFARLARRITAKKPIVAVKSGRTSAGSRAAASHTGALAGLDVASDALFLQAGVIRTDTLEELFDVATLLAHQPLPAGRRVAILTNSGGPGILAADACEGYGLEVLPLREETVARLREFLPAAAGLSNPVDLLASASADHYERALELLMKDGDIDCVIVIFTPPLVTEPEPVARAIRTVAEKHWGKKPVLSCFMSSRGAPPELSAGGRAVPSFAFPEGAARALACVSTHAEWRKQPRGSIPRFRSVRRAAARVVIEDALARSKGGETWLSPDGCAALLAAYGIRAARQEVARTERAAIEAARSIGFPVVAKIASTTITHKTEVGGVAVGLENEQELRDAVRAMRARLRAIGRAREMEGVLVQKMVAGGVETIVGVTQDPSFGPLIMFGLGGTFVELLKDVAFRIQPLTDVDARKMVRSVKGYPLLEGWRGAEPADVAALEELLLRVSAMAEDVPELAEMDLNPVKVLGRGRGCVVVDARVLLRALQS